MTATADVHFQKSQGGSAHLRPVLAGMASPPPRRLVAESIILHPIFHEIVTSALPRAAVLPCMRIAYTVLLRNPDAEAEIFRTEDGGASLDFLKASASTSLTFVVPGDGSVRYFVARGPDRFRRAGVVLEDEAIGNLGRWLADIRTPFPDRGLEIG